MRETPGASSTVVTDRATVSASRAASAISALAPASSVRIASAER